MLFNNFIAGKKNISAGGVLIMFLVLGITVWGCSQNTANIETNDVNTHALDKLEIIETINRFFIAVDRRDWDTVKKSFSPQVQLDYTSMTGGEPVLLKPEQIIDSWKTILPGFDKTHHQLGNYVTEVKGATGTLMCYGTATHYLRNDTGINLWTVVGAYEFSLENKDGKWKIKTMKFILRYIDGNTKLPEMAQEKLKSNQGR